MSQVFVVVGAGMAGAKAAEALRKHGFDGRLVLVGTESELPYERPPLSKGYLRGESTAEDAEILPDSFYTDNEVELRLGTTVSELRLEPREVVLQHGESIAFDRAVIATGARPRTLQVDGAQLPEVRYLRSLEDASAIREHLDRDARLAVIGGGWIGAEVAASARQKGLEVTLVEHAQVPLERVLGEEVGRIYADVHRDHGVELVTGWGISRFEGTNRLEAVRLEDGTRIEADVAVVGVGVTPRVELAAAAGLDVDNGILVDQHLETSAEGIFAVGDVANAFHPFYKQRLRVEHWANALNQPETAALGMLGRHRPYERLPYFFSDQYEVGMEYTGYASDWDRVLFRGDVDTCEFIAFWIKDGRVVAGMNVGVWDVTDAIKTLILSKQAMDVVRLADPDTPLASLVEDVSPAALTSLTGRTTQGG